MEYNEKVVHVASFSCLRLMMRVIVFMMIRIPLAMMTTLMMIMMIIMIIPSDTKAKSKPDTIQHARTRKTQFQARS